MSTVGSAAVARPPAERLPILGVGSAHTMVKISSGLGMTPEACLNDTGLALSTLADPGKTIRLEQELAVARNVVRGHADIPAIGMLFARHYGATLYGSFGLGMLSAPTGREALRFGQQYLDLSYACCSIQSTENDTEYLITVNGDRLPRDVRDFFVERSVMAVVRLLGDLLPGQGWLRWISLTMPEPRHADTYRSMVQTEVHFGRAANQVSVDVAAVGQALPMANEWAFREAESVCEQELAARRGRTGVTGEVREYLTERMPGLPSITDAARQLGLSERTLRRRLAAEGTSFRHLSDRARRTVAERLLAQGELPSQVARHVGFLEPAAFSHAFKRWHGVSPTEYARAR